MIINENAIGHEGVNRSISSIKSMSYYAISDVVSKFRIDMHNAGIPYSGEIVPDGIAHRIHIDGHKLGSSNGEYKLHIDERPAGYFKDYKSGVYQPWNNIHGSRVSYTSIKNINKDKLKREADLFQKHNEAASKAVYILNHAKPLTSLASHAYLLRKHIQPNGARLYKDALVITIYNESARLVNLQFINALGEKRFLTGGRKRGCFHILGNVTTRILICEGFATGASLYEETGQRVVVAFDAGNLLPVAMNIRELSPDTEIIICADNDLSRIGQTKAREAALVIGGKLLIPFSPGLDWNDVLTGGCKNG